jgi:hypothetical protein
VTQTLHPQQPPALPATPRPITPRAARRAWGEAPVRFWWKSALVVALVTLYIAAFHVQSALRQRRLMRAGTPLMATITEVNGTPRANFTVVRDDEVHVKVTGTLPDGKELKDLPLALPASPGRYAKVGAELKLMVDPSDPEHRWAEETDEILPWWRVLAVPLFLLLPVMLILMALAEWRRRQMLAVWREGQALEAVVVSSKHAATAPMSRIVQFTPAHGSDKRVFKTLYPTRAGTPVPGDLLHMIALPNQPQRAIVARLYQEG